MILFHQFFDQTSSTLTYLLADPLSGDAVIIDSVKEHLGAYLTFLQEQELQLAWVLETHVHADHVTGAAGLREMTGARSAVSAVGGVLCADRQLIDGDTIVFGSEVIRVIPTPGHTPGCVTYHWRDRIFCGDVLELGGCGQAVDETDAGLMYDSVRKRIYSLPGETLVFPGHDYAGRTVSTVAEERQRNTVFSGLTRDRFIEHLERVEKRPVLREHDSPKPFEQDLEPHPLERK